MHNCKTLMVMVVFAEYRGRGLHSIYIELNVTRSMRFRPKQFVAND